VIAFPATPGCIVCGSLAQTVVDLSSRGKIESCTRVGERNVCEIRLENGPLVMAGVDHSAPLAVGTTVRFEPRDHVLRFVSDV